MALIFDSHAHYDAVAFDSDREELLCSLGDKGVGGVLNAASDVASSRAGIALADRHPFVWAAVGIHPEEAAAAPEGAIDTLRTLYAHTRVVAVGEIGLDYHAEELCPRETQKRWFRRQLELARELDAPVILHDREAHEDTLRLVREFHPRGVLHCYSGSVEMLREVLRLGLYIGLGGVVTFKNARRAVEAAAAVPLDRLLLETDAPYMAPVPFRGKRCDSSMLTQVAARIAEVRGISVDALIRQTDANVRTLFALPADN